MSSDAEWAKNSIEKFLSDFDAADTENNGTLRFREVARALVRAGWKGKYFETKRLFNAIDTDEDKLISRAEYKKVFEKFPVVELKTMSLRSQFELIDADKSGKLTKEEIMDSIPKAELSKETEKLSNLLIGLIRDKDGKLDYEEFLKLYKEKENK